MTADEEVEGLTRWASRSHAADRSRLLLALANVVASDDLRGRPRAQACLDVLLPALVLDADQPTRAELTARLADAPWAPASLLTTLAQEPGEVSRPLLARSPCLDEDSLASAALEADVDLQLALARRRTLPTRLIDALMDRGDPDVLPVLAANPNARFSSAQIERLTELSLHLLPLRLPLARRPELTAQAAGTLAQNVNASSQRALAERFGLAAHGPGPPDAEAERLLVDKLRRSARLTPGFALRSLRDGKRGLFEQSVAALADQPIEEVRAALAAADPGALARTCEAAGLDRSLLPTIRARLEALEPEGPEPQLAGAEA